MLLRASGPLLLGSELRALCALLPRCALCKEVVAARQGCIGRGAMIAAGAAAGPHRIYSERRATSATGGIALACRRSRIFCRPGLFQHWLDGGLGSAERLMHHLIREWGVGILREIRLILERLCERKLRGGFNAD